MESVEIGLAMLLAVAASGYLVRALPFSLPLPLAQIALGAVIEGVFGHGVALDPQLFFLLFLPPLLFLDGWRIPNDGLRRDRAVILELALGLVVFTIVGAGLLIQGGSHFVANDPKGEGDSGEIPYAIGQIGLSWLKVFLECDARYKQFLKKPSDASEWQTTVQ